MLPEGISSYDPRDSTPPNNLAALYSKLGQFEKALGNGRQAMELDPDNYTPYGNVAGFYVSLNRLDEAKAVLDSAVRRNLGGTTVHIALGEIACAHDNMAEMEREFALAKTTPEGELSLTFTRAHLAASL